MVNKNPSNGKPSASFGDEENDPDENAVKYLQEQLEAEKDARLNERLLFILAAIILLNVIFLQDSQNWSYPIVILIFEMIGLSFLAQMMGNEEIPRIINRIISAIRHIKPF